MRKPLLPVTGTVDDAGTHLRVDLDIFANSFLARNPEQEQTDVMARAKREQRVAELRENVWPRQKDSVIPNDVNLMDILTIQLRVVMVTSTAGQDEAAIEAFKKRAADLLAIMRMLGDRRCSMKVEWRKGIDAWTAVEMSTDDIKGLQGHIADLGHAANTYKEIK